ncbi:MAG: hypothetical protein Q9181_007401 [Wetmoreana brouardii]
MYSLTTSLLLVLTAWIQPAFTTPSSQPSSPSISLPTQKLTLGPVPPSMTFRISKPEHPLAIQLDGAFVNAIEALRIVAPQDFNGSTPLRTFRTWEYLNPAVTLTSHDLTPIKTSYAIWGLYITFSWLARPGKAIATIFTILHNNQTVGEVTYGCTLCNAGGQKDGGNTAVSEDIPKPGVGGPAPQAPSNKNHVTMIFFYDGPPFVWEKEDMQIAMLNVLTQAAQYPNSTRIEGDGIDRTWMPRIQDPNCWFSAQSDGSGLDFAHVIEAVAAAARFVVRHGVYRELFGEIIDDGDVIGRVRFHRAF